jgi:hypothetical protein
VPAPYHDPGAQRVRGSLTSIQVPYEDENAFDGDVYLGTPHLQRLRALAEAEGRSAEEVAARLIIQALDVAGAAG